MNNCPLCNGPTSDHFIDFESMHYQICRNCDVVYASNKAPKYDSLYQEEYIRDYVEYTYNFNFNGVTFNLISDLLSDRFGDSGNRPKILDVGCGVGFFLDIARTFGCDTKGVEPNIIEAEWGRKNLDLDIFTGYIEEARFPKKSFDVVYCSEVFEHLEDPLRFGRHIGELLKDDGFLVITTPNFRSKEYGTGPGDPKFALNSGRMLLQIFHVTLFSPASLKNLLHGLAFKQIFVSGFFGSENDERLLAVASKDKEFSVDLETLNPLSPKPVQKITHYYEDRLEKINSNSSFWEGIAGRLAEIYYKQEEYDKSNKIIEVLLERLDSRGLSKYQIAQKMSQVPLIKMLNSQQQEVLLQFIRKLPAYLPSVYWTYGMNLLNQKKYDRSSETFKELRSLYQALFQLPDPGNFYTYYTSIFNRGERPMQERRWLYTIYHEGLSLLFLEKRQDAIESFDEVLRHKLIVEMIDLLKDSVFAKGIALLQLARYDQAKSQFERIINGNFSQEAKEQAEFHLALCYRYAGERNRALQILEKLLGNLTTTDSSFKARLVAEREAIIGTNNKTTHIS